MGESADRASRTGHQATAWRQAQHLDRRRELRAFRVIFPTRSRRVSDRRPRSCCFRPRPMCARGDCVEVECKVFTETYPGQARAGLRARSSRTSSSPSAARFFPSTATEHWTLFAGLTDIPFCDEADTFVHRQPTRSKRAFVDFVGELVDLLKRIAEPQHGGISLPAAAWSRPPGTRTNARRGARGPKLPPAAGSDAESRGPTA